MILVEFHSKFNAFKVENRSGFVCLHAPSYVLLVLERGVRQGVAWAAGRESESPAPRGPGRITL